MNLLEDNSAPVEPTEKENKHAPRIMRKGYLKGERVKRLYMRQLEGLTAKQLVLDHAKKEQVSEETAWRDWREVAKLNEEDFARERETMGARIFALRQKVFNAAMRRGQMNTAAQVLDSLARQVGCDEPQGSEMLPEIRVRVEPPAELPARDANQLPVIDVKNHEDVENA